jgi:MFS family permease
MVLGGVAGSIVNERLPGHQTDPVNVLLSAIVALGGVFVGGAAWGWALGRITGVADRRRMTIAGALGFGPGAILAALALTVLESIIVEQNQGPQLPIHNIFTILFVPAATIVTGIGSCAIAIGAHATASQTRDDYALIGGAAF